MKPAKHEYTILKQICSHIPAHLVPKLARAFGADKKARSFSPWSHIVVMLHVDIAHSLSLNDVAELMTANKNCKLGLWKCLTKRRFLLQ